ncbi:hypothetical protein [Candidatus Caldatribacterium sp.]|uniref:hypothetical protein n=1 Tax=Candidatus Caldatribacterium sp. TaxID=2282143 RepID=UPI00383E3B8F|nr:hypothetical protein [Candidatus Caldatribacterium sp.]
MKLSELSEIVTSLLSATKESTIHTRRYTITIADDSITFRKNLTRFIPDDVFARIELKNRIILLCRDGSTSEQSQNDTIIPVTMKCVSWLIGLLTECGTDMADTDLVRVIITKTERGKE